MKKNRQLIPISLILSSGLLFLNCGGSDSTRDGTGGSGGSGGNGTGAKGGTVGTSAKDGAGGTSANGGAGGTNAPASTGTGGAAGSTLVGTGGTIPASEPLKPIGFWKFDETSGAAVKDSSGNGMSGNVVQGSSADAAEHPSPSWVKGHTGMGIQLDGVDDWIRVVDSDLLDGTGLKNSVSISAWIKLDKYNPFKPWTVIAQRGQAASRLEHFMLGINNGTPGGEVNFFKVSTLVNVPLNKWVHMAFTYDGLKAIVYMDGAVVGEADIGWPLATDETPFTIGAGINETDVIENAPGIVDDVQLYDGALSASEVDALAKRPAD